MAKPIAGAPPRPPQAAFRDIHTRGAGAIAVVSRNPEAFKGRPINTAILPRQAGAPAPQRTQLQSKALTETEEPHAAAPRTATHPPVPEKPPTPAPPPQEASRPETVRTPQNVEHAEVQRGSTDVRASGDKKVEPKKAAKPVQEKPETEKPRPDDTQH
jgi:hypothetical protein